MAEICEGLRAIGGKLNHVSLEWYQAKSTANDGICIRESTFRHNVYYKLMRQYQSYLSDSLTFGLTFKTVLLLDSVTIRLFSDILKEIGCNSKNDGKKKG
jgi:hypothetical protein